LKGESDPAVFRKSTDSVIVPEFTPKSGIKVQISDNDPVPQANTGKNQILAKQSTSLTIATDDDDLEEVISRLPPPSSLAGYRLTPVEFEKDDDTNYHIDFITAASNLRATNYGTRRNKLQERLSLPLRRLRPSSWGWSVLNCTR
jgi:ubiquitin-activating enzyme E1